MIASVGPGSIAEQLGWRQGDKIVSINGHFLHDILDFRFYCSDSKLSVVLRRGGRERQFEIEKDYDEPLGVEFRDILFDGVRLCGAHCIFCFVDQLPKGLRASLYIKDDDFRLSFIHGNFITLANVSQDDLQRIITQRLSPLYVSVHTTNHALRERMLGRSCPDILRQIDTLAAGRITLHTQIVLCRGINDGAELDRTISDLAARHPCVASIAVVPAAAGKHRRSKTPLTAIDAQYSAEILDTVAQHQARYRRDLGTRLVWAADEFHLSTGRPVPGAAAYEGFPQIENGVGLVRCFKDDTYRAKRRLPKQLAKPLHVSIITGELAAPLVRKWAESLDCENLKITVHPIRNDLFGPTVSVSGLIAGWDVIDQLRGQNLGDLLIVPKVALCDGAFLDDVTLDDLAAELDVPVKAVDPIPRAVVSEIVGRANCQCPATLVQ